MALNDDLNALVPATFEVVFPRTLNGESTPDTPYTLATTLTALALPQYQTATGRSGVKRTEYSSVVAAVTTSSVADNHAELLAMTTIMAKNFYLWQLGSAAAAYEGVAAWSMEGHTDLVVFSHLAAVATLAVRGEWQPAAPAMRLPYYSDTTGSEDDEQDGGTTNYNNATINYLNSTTNYSNHNFNMYRPSYLNLYNGYSYTVRRYGPTTSLGFFIFEVPAKFKRDVWLDYETLDLSAEIAVVELEVISRPVLRFFARDPYTMLAGMVPHLDTGTGRISWMFNVGTTGSLQIHNEDGLESNPTYRFRTPNADPVVLRPGEGCQVWYDPVTERHRVMGFCCDTSPYSLSTMGVARPKPIGQLGIIGAGKLVIPGTGVAKPIQQLGVSGAGLTKMTGSGVAIPIQQLGVAGAGTVSTPDVPPYCSTSRTYTVTVVGVTGGGSCTSANGPYATTHTGGSVWFGATGSITATLDLSTSTASLVINLPAVFSATYTCPTFSCSTGGNFLFVASTGSCGWPATILVTVP